MPQPSSQATTPRPAPTEKRVTLQVDWDGFEAILNALPQTRSAHLTYHHGLLEIMTPPESHEQSSDLIGDVIKIWAEALDLPLKSMVSTTLKRADLDVGAEPDRGFYIANEPKVRGKWVDLATDPPPDLVIEIDITHTDITKTPSTPPSASPNFGATTANSSPSTDFRTGAIKRCPTAPLFPSFPKNTFIPFCKTVLNRVKPLLGAGFVPGDNRSSSLKPTLEAFPISTPGLGVSQDFSTVV